MLIAASAPLVASLSAAAQAAAPGGASAIPAGSNWQHVQALPVGTYLHVNAQKRHAVCTLTAVTETSLSCNRDTGVGTRAMSFDREEIRTVKLARRGRSALLGGAILGGAGAIAGGVQGSRSNYYAVKGAFAMIYGFSGAFAGAPIGYLSDFSASTVYRAP